MINVVKEGQKSSSLERDIGLRGLGLPVLIILWHHTLSYIRGFYLFYSNILNMWGRTIHGALTVNPLWGFIL